MQLQFGFGYFGQSLGAGRGQGLLDRVAHGLVPLAAVAKADLDLGGVHVHIDQRWIDLNEQGIGRLFMAVQHVLVGTASAMHDDLVAHEAAVHIGKLVVGARSGRIGCTCAAHGAQRADLEVHPNRLSDKLVAQNVGQALLQPGRARMHTPLFGQLAFVPDGKAYVRSGQGVAAYRLDAVRQLGAVALEEFAARWGGEEQFLDFDGGAHGTGGRAHLSGAAVQREGAGLTLYA